MDQDLRETLDPPAEPHQRTRGEKGTGKTFYETRKQTRKEGERIMIATETALENLTLNIQQEIRVNASLENTFEALLEQLGPSAENENGPMPMKLEAWP